MAMLTRDPHYGKEVLLANVKFTKSNAISSGHFLNSLKEIK